jgi:hypothetical protein
MMNQKSKKNKGNFRELVDLLEKQNDRNKRLLRNAQMVAPHIQKRYCKLFCRGKEKIPYLDILFYLSCTIYVDELMVCISAPQTCASSSYCDGVGGKDFFSSEDIKDGLVKPNRRWIYK